MEFIAELGLVSPRVLSAVAVQVWLAGQKIKPLRDRPAGRETPTKLDRVWLRVAQSSHNRRELNLEKRNGSNGIRNSMNAETVFALQSMAYMPYFL